jgi:hypothetical protein
VHNYFRAVNPPKDVLSRMRYRAQMMRGARDNATAPRYATCRKAAFHRHFCDAANF